MKQVRKLFFGTVAAGKHQKIEKNDILRKIGVWRIQKKPGIDVNF